MEPANRRPASGAGSVSLPANLTVTDEQAAAGSLQPGQSGGGATYTALFSGPVARSQPSGRLKPTAVDLDPSEPGASMETNNRRISSNMYGPLSGRPDGTTANAQVANACPAAGECPNKTPIFISGVSDTRSFLAWMWASCPGGLMAQLKGEKLMVVPSTAEGFRAAVIALRSLDGKGGVSFHTFTLLEERCAQLLVKNLDRGMPESVVREKLESLNIRVQGVTEQPTTPKLLVPTQTPTSALEEISDILHHLPLHSCVELTCRLLTSMSSLTTCAARPCADLKTVILFVAEYGSNP